MEPVMINYWAVLVSAIGNMVLGGLWYSPILFGKQWMHYMGLTMEHMEKHKRAAQKSYAMATVGSLLMAYVLSHIVDYAGASTFVHGLQAGFWVWLGFVVPVSASSFLWEGKPLSLFVINASYYLVSLSLMGGLLTVWL